MKLTLVLGLVLALFAYSSYAEGDEDDQEMQGREDTYEGFEEDEGFELADEDDVPNQRALGIPPY